MDLIYAHLRNDTPTIQALVYSSYVMPQINIVLLNTF